MKIWDKLKNWWEDNQEKSSERYIEREELIEELEEYSKDIRAIISSPISKINERPLEKAILIQNLHTQRNLKKATDSLKTATWVLALATIIFAWATIVDSPNSGYIIKTLQGVVGIIAFFLIVVITVALAWKIIKFVFRWLRKKNENQNP
ncbi:MAG: hypothetical protein ABIJ14_01550 [Nanoarchaeota archaeon]